MLRPIIQTSQADGDGGDQDPDHQVMSSFAWRAENRRLPFVDFQLRQLLEAFNEIPNALTLPSSLMRSPRLIKLATRVASTLVCGLHHIRRWSADRLQRGRRSSSARVDCGVGLRHCRWRPLQLVDLGLFCVVTAGSLAATAAVTTGRIW